MHSKILGFGLIVLLLSSFSIADLSLIQDNVLLGVKPIVLKGVNYKVLKPVDSMFQKMREAALKEGINIQIVSSYRSFNQQKGIWTRKYNKYISEGLSPQASIAKIIEYSTIPGTSRHHWGTDIDIIDANVKKPNGDILLEKHFENDGVYCPLKSWMDLHSESYGFYLVYTSETQRKGFKYEPWHYSYKPVSKAYLKAYQKIDLLAFLRENKIKGSEYITPKFIAKYTENNILDINPDLVETN